MGALKKATLGIIDDKGGEVGKPFDVMFNPKELTFSKQNNWQSQKEPKAGSPELDFSGGSGMTLKVQLYFDTYDPASGGGTGGKQAAKTVTTLTDEIHKLMVVDKNAKNGKSKKGRPPYVRFHWGHIVFDGVITSYGQRLTLFTPDGLPVRAVVDLSLTQYKESLIHKQNPTSGGVGGERVWTVQAGDTLPWIAYKEYNNATAWRPIADANGLTNVRNLRIGTVLVIPNA